MLTEEATNEAKQRTAYLLNKAMEAEGITASQLSARLGKSSALYKQIVRVQNEDILPRLDTLGEMLEACGFELTISMKRKVEDDGDE